MQHSLCPFHCHGLALPNEPAPPLPLPDHHVPSHACNSISRPPVRPPQRRPLQVNMEVECRWVSDMLRGDDCYELRLKLKEHRDEKFPYKDDD